jgi:hypothetical protein
MGRMKDYDIRIRNGGDDAIRAVSELIPQWISVDERLPSGLCFVLATCGDHVFEATYWPSSRQFGTDNGGMLDSVTHWMELPAPPE